jgi:hypothetical protein
MQDAVYGLPRTPLLGTWVNKDSRKDHSPVASTLPALSPLVVGEFCSYLRRELRMQTFEEALRYGLKEGIEGSNANEHPLAVGCNHIFPVG